MSGPIRVHLTRRRGNRTFYRSDRGPLVGHQSNSMQCWICGDSLENSHHPNIHLCNAMEVQAQQNNDYCFLCGDPLQNSERNGVHLCNGDSVAAHAIGGDEQYDIDFWRLKRLTHLCFQIETLESDQTEAAIKKDTEDLSEAAKALGDESKAKSIKDKGEGLGKQSRIVRVQRKEQLQRFLHLSDIYSGLKRKEREVAGGKNTFEEYRVSCAKQLREREDAVGEREKSLERVDKAAKQAIEKHASMLRLNVGGQPFNVSLKTLTSVPDSMLGAMFSGRHELKKDETGAVFIDRDPRYFRFILGYLRGGLPYHLMPWAREELEALRQEADYFLLEKLRGQVDFKIKCIHSV